MNKILEESQVKSYLPAYASTQNLSFFNNVIFGTPFNDYIPTTFLNDIVIALGGNDRITGSFGNDIFVGGEGKDIADYSKFNQAITLGATGVINKGSFGTDLIYEIETIIGAKGKANVIDGTNKSTTTSLNVNLAKQSLIVNGVPSLGRLQFTVENFVNVIGTSQGDTIVGDNYNNLLDGKAGNDTIFGLGGDDSVFGCAGYDVIGGGSKSSFFVSRFSDGNDIVQGGTGNDTLIGGTGNDSLDGGSGFDTADYRNLGQAITLEAAGVVNKGFAGTDQIKQIERIIGGTGRANAIDGSTGKSNTTSFNINLNKESLVVNGIPGIGSAKFQVQNFVNVTGTSQGDSIIGNSKNNVLEGGRGNDKISGLGGKDTLIGVDSESFTPGRYEVDILSGGTEADTFVLGNAKKSYYTGGGGFFGLNDFAYLTDFKTGEDKLELSKSQRYILGRNFIAVSNFYKPYPLPYETANDELLVGGDALIGNEVSSSIADSTVDEIIQNNGVFNTVSLGSSASMDTQTKLSESSVESSLFIPFPSFDIVAIVADSYSYSDIHFV